MAQCPHCQSSNVVVTEEVYTRKGRIYYRFWQTVALITFFIIGNAIDGYGLALILGLIGAMTVSVFSLFNAGKRARSKTKLSCLNCHKKTFL